MPDERLLQPIAVNLQMPSENLPRDWPRSLQLDYLNGNEVLQLIAERVELLSEIAYDLQKRVEALESAP